MEARCMQYNCEIDAIKVEKLIFAMEELTSILYLGFTVHIDVDRKQFSRSFGLALLHWTAPRERKTLMHEVHEKKKKPAKKVFPFKLDTVGLCEI